MVYTGRDLLALAFLAAVLSLVLWQIFRGLNSGVMYVPGKRRIFKVVRANSPLSFWGAFGFYCLMVVALHMAAWGVVRPMLWPGPSEPARLTVVALDHATVEVSWLSPERRDPAAGLRRLSRNRTGRSSGGLSINRNRHQPAISGSHRAAGHALLLSCGLKLRRPTTCRRQRRHDRYRCGANRELRELAVQYLHGAIEYAAGASFSRER